MSHFSVAVFMTDKGQSVDDLLAPYEENLFSGTDEGTVKEDADEVTGGEDPPFEPNPDMKWDWYVIGGRWKGLLILKGNVQAGCDAALVSDIDFEAIRQRNLAELCPYEEAMNDPIMGEEYMRKVFRNNEEYISLMSPFSTYAVITPDGECNSYGTMCWFGYSSSKPEDERKWKLGYHDRFIKPALENNWYMVLVDCHI